MWLAVLATIGDASVADADRRALQRTVRGDHDALAEVCDRHARLVYSLALRIVGRQPDAEDVLQEVFTQVWRQASRYDTSRGTVAGWLVMLTRSRALDRLRRERAEVPAADIDWASVDVVDPETAVDLQTLPEAQRVPLELGYYDGLSQSAIAARLGVPLGTVKTRMRQALLRLRDALAEARP